MFYPLSRHPDPFEAQVRRGATFAQAAMSLGSQGLVRDPVLFMLAGYASGLNRRLKAGYYAFPAGDYSLWDIMKVLRAGGIVERTVLIPEGETLADIRGRLVAAGLIEGPEFDRLSHDAGFMAVRHIEAPSLEGYLFPDTYIIPKGMPVEEIVTMMVRRLRQKLTPQMLQRARAMGLNEREVLTLASIVEKEARLDRDRPMVAEVYLNRLKMRMPLQSDPTAVYGIKPLGVGVTPRDLKNRTEYNTYMIAGLPPGPIASPGLKSIEAVLNPASGPWLYFVADGRTGGHVFSATEKEHERAVAAYRRAMRRR